MVAGGSRSGAGRWHWGGREIGDAFSCQRTHPRYGRRWHVGRRWSAVRQGCGRVGWHGQDRSNAVQTGAEHGSNNLGPADRWCLAPFKLFQDFQIFQSLQFETKAFLKPIICQTLQSDKFEHKEQHSFFA
jgi:hypothetical protein